MSISLSSGDVDLLAPGAFGPLGVMLDSLEEEGHLYISDASYKEDRRTVRISRTYLWLLGYIKKDNEHDEPDKQYRQGVARFLNDVGLASEEGLGRDGWQLLKSLAAYDTDINIKDWLGQPVLSPALIRSVHLRLFSYGLMSRPPEFKTKPAVRYSGIDKALQAGLNNFVRMSSLLGLHEAELNPVLDQALLIVLFSHRDLIRALRFKNGSFVVYPQHSELGLKSVKLSRLSRNFIGNLALVELWLLGYEVRPGNFKSEGAHGREQGGGYRKALSQFARNRGIEKATLRSVGKIAWFFQEASRIINTPEDQSVIEDDQLNAVLSSSKNRNELTKAYRSLGARIIDGVVRVVRWVAGWFKRVIKAVKVFYRHIARALHGVASDFYLRLKAIVQVCAEGGRYFFTSPIAGSSWNGVYINKKADFDMDVFINSNATEAVIERFFDALDLRVRAMKMGGEVILQLISIIKSVLSISLAVLGWLGLIVSLVKLARWLRKSAKLANKSLSIVEEFKQLEVIQ